MRLDRMTVEAVAKEHCLPDPCQTVFLAPRLDLVARFSKNEDKMQRFTSPTT